MPIYAHWFIQLTERTEVFVERTKMCKPQNDSKMSKWYIWTWDQEYKETNSTRNKSQSHRARAHEVTSFLSTDCELSTETCSKNVYILGPQGLLVESGILPSLLQLNGKIGCPLLRVRPNAYSLYYFIATTCCHVTHPVCQPSPRCQ